MSDQRDVRASDHDRDGVAETLRAAVSDGRITLEELEERLDRTYRARTLRELDEIVADLPSTAVAPALDGPPPGGAPLLHARRGRVARTGRWTVPRRMKVRADRWGNVKLDFTRADCPHREVVVDVEITSWFGNVVIIVPIGWRARDDEVIRLRLGAVFNAPKAPLAADGVTVRLTGYVKTGDILVRYRPRAW